MTYNVTIEPIHPHTRAIIGPGLAKFERRNIARRDHALKHLYAALYECLSSGMLDTPRAWEAVKFCDTIAADMKAGTLRKNWRYTFLIREYIVTLETWR
jgi:hypothetical protein